jgi:5-hydroxyisourate hydrolase-like protein (transthyretin family)
MTPETIKPGRYQAVAYTGEYFKKIGAKVPGGYHTKLILEFDIYDAKQPHHLPFQITPWTQSASVLPG